MFKNVDLDCCIDVNLTRTIFIDSHFVKLHIKEAYPPVDINTIDIKSRRYEAHLINQQ